MSTKLQNAALLALKDYMCITEDETLLVITDASTKNIGRALYEAGLQIAREAFYIEMREREVNGQEPHEQIAELMKTVDVVMCATAKTPNTYKSTYGSFKTWCACWYYAGYQCWYYGKMFCR